MALSVDRLPGFVDLQVNGYLGVDFSLPDLTVEKVRTVAAELTKRGCAGFLATVVTSPEEAYRQTFQVLAEAMELPEVAPVLLGIHAEGPFLSDRPGAVGAHRPDCVRKPSIEFFQKMQEWSRNRIRVLTIAAENEGAAELTRYAADHGVIVSLGHHLADYEDVRRCTDAGASWLTHLGNGCPNEMDRHHNPVWAGLAETRLTGGFIADGHHLPRPLIGVMLRAKGIANSIVVSDASPIAGMPPGKYYTLGNNAILEPDGLLHNPEKRCLVGSSANIFQCANVLAEMGCYTPEEIVQLTYCNPLRKLGIDPEAFAAARPVRCGWDAATRRFVLRSEQQ